MTYQVLARKWRPRTFSDMAGQEHVLQTLIHALNNQRLHHAYLFTGTRGVGKTTIARIFAKCLNCEQGVSATPCGKCTACTQIAEGRFIDLIEVDAASKTKVEDTRELLENVQYAPSVGRYKVYLIDEVHMLSSHSFNALLKTLEEPPPHVIFLLATTDPHKLPITILSRCLQFSLKNLSPQMIAEYLKSVLVAEQIPFEEAALWSIAKAAQGSMRDALTLLDQSISFCAGNVTDAEVSSLLGTPDQALVMGIVQALNADNAPGLLDIANTISSRAFDYFMLLDNLLALLHRIAIAQLVPGGIDNSQGDREQVLALARELSAEQVQLYYQIALNGRQDMSLAFDARIAFEMLLMRLLVFSPQAPQEQESAILCADPEQKKKPDSGLTATAQAVITPASISAPEPESEPELEPAPETEAAQSAQGKILPGIAEAATRLPETSADTPDTQEKTQPLPRREAPTPHASLTAEDTEEFWITLVDALEVGGITGNLLANCVLLAMDENSITLALDETQSALFSDEHGRRIGDVLREHFRRPLEVHIEIQAIHMESPAHYRQRKQEEALQRAQQAFEHDEHVQALVSAFSARILPNSVKIIEEAKK